jgi:hypothetical protein
VGLFQIFVGCLIAAGWASALVDGMVTGDYQALDLTMPLMMILDGYTFGETLIRKRYPNKEVTP